MSQEPTDTTGTAESTNRNTTDPDRRDRADRDVLRWLSAIAALVGLWVAASPFLYEEATEMATWNNVVVGAVIFLLAAYNFYRMTDRNVINVGSAGLAVLLGLWLVIAPFLLEFGSEALQWSTIVSGAVVVLLSGYNAYRGSTAERAPTAGMRT